MLKRGEFNTSFKRRFFRFAETAGGLACLVYYKNMEDDEPRGRVSLVCALLVDSPDPPDQSSPLDFAGALRNSFFFFFLLPSFGGRTGEGSIVFSFLVVGDGLVVGQFKWPPRVNSSCGDNY
jgi:hypothetical protein